MYKLNVSLPKNRNPWIIPLEIRKKNVLEAYDQGIKPAILLYHTADTSTFRYRCYNLWQATSKSKKWRSVYFFINEVEDLIQLLPFCKILIFSRLKWELVLDRVIEVSHNLKIPILFDIDDLVCDPTIIRLLTNTLNAPLLGEKEYDFWFAYTSRLEFCARLTDGFITTNAFLGNRLSEKFGKPHQIIINSLNLEQLDISSRCRVLKSKQSSAHPFCIGYFSGTPSHVNDFRIVHQELIQLLSNYPEMELIVIGFMKFPNSMNKLINQGRIKFKPLVDFMELQRCIAEVDVNIVPLAQNAFTNCKSELKFFEAAIVDTPTIASPVYTYSNAINDQYNGFLCEPGMWYNKIESLYRDCGLVNTVTSAAREYCLKQYSGDHVLWQIEHAYDYFAK